jgi:hypothetical protein
MFDEVRKRVAEPTLDVGSGSTRAGCQGRRHSASKSRFATIMWIRFGPIRPHQEAR